MPLYCIIHLSVYSRQADKQTHKQSSIPPLYTTNLAMSYHSKGIYIQGSRYFSTNVLGWQVSSSNSHVSRFRIQLCTAACFSLSSWSHRNTKISQFSSETFTKKDVTASSNQYKYESLYVSRPINKTNLLTLRWSIGHPGNVCIYSNALAMSCAILTRFKQVKPPCLHYRSKKATITVSLDAWAKTNKLS